jgi:hypothetical protein
VNCDKPIKSVSPKLARDSIFYLEVAQQFTRIAVQCNDEARIRSLMRDFIGPLESNCEVLLKVHSGDSDDGSIIWKYYIGEPHGDRLLEAVDRNHNAVFHDGYNQILARNKINQNYLCFDDHGILYFYLDSYDTILTALADFKKADDTSKFIFAEGHWHYRPGEAEQLLTELTADLQLNEG